MLRLLVVGHEEKGLVAVQRSSEGSAKLLARGGGIVAEDGAWSKLAVAKIVESAAVPEVGSGFRDDIHHASRGAAEFRGKAGAHDLEFPDRFLADYIRVVGSFPAALAAEKGLVEIGSVDV